MALHICVSHTGQRFLADANQLLSTEALRSWIAENTFIPPPRQILMTSRGKSVKQQHLMTEKEIFVYDKQYTLANAQIPSAPTPAVLPARLVGEAPSTISNETSLQSWQELFMARRTWALEAAEIVKNGADVVQNHSDEIENITRSAAVALENLKNHVRSLHNKFETTQKWANDALDEHRAALNDWKTSVQTLGEVPIREDLVEILQRPSTPTTSGGTSADTTLRDLVDVNGLESGAEDLLIASRTFEDTLRSLEESMHVLTEDTSELQRFGEKSWQGGETAAGLLEESETLAKRISNDYEDVLRYQNNSKSVATASRRALVHTRDLLPTMKTIADEMRQLQTTSVNRRKEALGNWHEAVRGIATLESSLTGLQTRISTINIGQRGNDGLDTINRTFQLPVTYGSLLVEAVRRWEWTEKMKNVTASLQDEILKQKEDEVRRRKIWAHSMEEFLQDLTGEEIMTDVTFSTTTGWPEVARSDVLNYLDILRDLGIVDAAQEVTRLLEESVSAAKPKKRPLKAFKNGSVYDLGQSSTLHAKGEDVKILQDDKLRLEDKLRASDSRIRKLEDLLHRQSQLNRPTSGNYGNFPDFERHASSPTSISQARPQELLSRKSSTASRRLSNQNQDEKGLARRIVALEAERDKLVQETHAERRSSTESRDRMQEAESVKRDLMANFEAQKQEFDDERQLLEEESHKLKIRIEELEDELDHTAGSRDHQRVILDRTVAELHTEIERLRRASTIELERVQNKFETVESSLVVQRDRACALDKEVQQYRDERSGLQSQNLSLAMRLREIEEQQQDHLSSLQAAHSNLSPAGSAPEDLRRLVRAIEILAEGSAIHVRGQEDALQLAVAENKAWEEKFNYAEAQMKRLNDRIASEDATSISLREALASERSQIASVQVELADQQAELKSLHAKFAAGETGSEALRDQLAQEEQKVGDLTQRAAAAEAQVQNTRDEIARVRVKVHSQSEKEKELLAHLNARGQRAKDLSERLFHHNDRMVRMLEQLGYSVTRQDDRLVIQRASKVTASTTLLAGATADSSVYMRRTFSGSSPTQHYSDSSDLDRLYWMSDADAEGEDSKFHGFISALSRLDLDAAVEMIIKRYKDVETLAKKYQKDSRGYREKSHRLQSEAHEKIAYRSFKEGDLALFLPTRNQATRPWAAFNVGAPHYFLREQDAHKLQSRDWLLARISRVEERVVDLSRSLGSNRGQHDRSSINTEASDGASTRSADDENPFELSDGLRWYMIDASEEKPGAPGTPGLGKSTVTASTVEVKGSMGKKADKAGITAGNAAVMVTKTLHKSLDSRRSSSGSKKGHTPSPSIANAPLLPSTNEGNLENPGPMVKHAGADLNLEQPAREDAQLFEVDDEVRHWLLNRSGPTEDEVLRVSPVRPIRHAATTLRQSQTPLPVKLQKRAASPARSRPWDKIWGIEYKMEEGNK